MIEYVDFYKGFEGEREIRLYGMYTLSIFDGYFENIMQALFDVQIAEKGCTYGLIHDWQTCTGWCDIYSEKTKIVNLEDEIDMFSKFKLTLLKDSGYKKISDHWNKTILDVNNAILDLLLNAKDNNCDVFIEEC